MITLRLRFAVTLAVVGVSAAAFARAQWEDNEWVDDHFEEAVDQLFPVPATECVAYWTYRDLYRESHEYSFVLKHDYNWETFTVVVRKPSGQSIWDQLFELHRSEPTAPVAELLPEIAMDVWELGAAECPEMRLALEKLLALEMPIHNKMGGIVLHPWIRKIRAVGTVLNIEATITLDEHPLAMWAESTRLELEKCLGRSTAANKAAAAGRSQVGAPRLFVTAAEPRRRSAAGRVHSRGRRSLLE